VTRAQALAALATIIVRHQPDVGAVLDLLDMAGGNARLAAAIRRELTTRPAEVAGMPRPDAAMWARGRL
jgi:hypothetical protein